MADQTPGTDPEDITPGEESAGNEIAGGEQAERPAAPRKPAASRKPAAPRKSAGAKRRRGTGAGKDTRGEAAAPAAGKPSSGSSAKGAAGKPAPRASGKAVPRKNASAGSAGKPGSPARAGAAKPETADEQTAVTVAAEAGAPAGAAAAAASAASGGGDREAGAASGPSGASAPESGATGPEPGAATGVTRVLAPIGRALVSQRRARPRSWIALVLVIMAVLAIVVSVVALWSRDLIFNTDTYVKTVAPIADDPEVRHAVSVYVTDKAIEATDLTDRIESALPSDAKILAAPLTSQLRTFLIDEIDSFLGTDLARRIWVDINRFGHEQLISALEDENRYLTVGENDVKLNLLPLVAVALQKLSDQIPRLLGEDVQLPNIDPDTAPAQIRTLLQDALGRPLPDDFGSITVLKGSQGYEAKQALRLFKELVTLVVIVTVGLIVAALLVSPHKRRTALQLGIGALLGFVAARIIEVQLEEAIVNAIKSSGGAAVARSIIGSAIQSLNGFFIWVAIAGVIVAIAAFLASRPTWVAAMGRGFAKLFGVASDLSAPDTRAGRWMAAHLDLLRIGGVAVAIVLLLFIAGSLTAVLVVLIALIVYELALTAYAVGLPKQSTPPGTSA